MEEKIKPSKEGEIIMAHIIQNKDDLEKQLEDAGEKLVVIDFFANWCGPCKIINPKLEELAQQYADRAVVLKINVDECEEIVTEYNITSMPTFVFLKNRQVIDVFVGGNPEKLVKNMEKFVGEPIPDQNTPEVVTTTAEVVAVSASQPEPESGTAIEEHQFFE